MANQPTEMSWGEVFDAVRPKGWPPMFRWLDLLERWARRDRQSARGDAQ